MSLNKYTGFVIITVVAMGLVLALYFVYMTSALSTNNYSYPRFMTGGYWGFCPMNVAPRSSSKNAERLDIEEVKTRLESYTESLGPNYLVAEIMEFSNNFYAVIVERHTGNGAFEVLVDPYTGVITPEPGPNMMWNLKYGMHSRGMMGLTVQASEMPITEDEARSIALDYLSHRFKGDVELMEPTRFYGYYTIDYMINGKIHGMLSVNGFSGDVWYHSWHGEFIQEIEMNEDE